MEDLFLQHEAEEDAPRAAQILSDCQDVFKRLESIVTLSAKVELINKLKLALHGFSPFRGEPVDCVVWIENGLITKNSYNPNAVSPPEMELLKTSILSDGYTQPIVAFGNEVVDGFHRNRVGKECPEVTKRVHGYLPIVQIRTSQSDQGDRMAATIRHNRARGKHKVEAMSDIVIELKRRNWTDAKISKELGMDADEVLRLCQITGLAEMFKDQDFSKSWDVEDFEDEGQSDELEGTPVERPETNGRVYHTFDKWECHPAGFYEDKPKDRPDATKPQLEREYADFLADDTKFTDALERVISEWPMSCEHYLSNENMNRIAWLGQASACIALGIPSAYRGGFHLLSEKDQNKADGVALVALNKWLVSHGREPLTLQDAQSKTEANLY